MERQEMAPRRSSRNKTKQRPTEGLWSCATQMQMAMVASSQPLPTSPSSPHQRQFPRARQDGMFPRETSRSRQMWIRVLVSSLRWLGPRHPGVVMTTRPRRRCHPLDLPGPKRENHYPPCHRRAAPRQGNRPRGRPPPMRMRCRESWITDRRWCWELAFRRSRSNSRCHPSHRSDRTPATRPFRRPRHQIPVRVRKRPWNPC